MIDTHALVWAVADSRRLSPAARARLTTPGERLCVSAVTAWEYTDLHRRGRLSRAGPFETVVRLLRIEILPLPADIWRVALSLPDIHGDPVDRMLVAHAITADLELMTADGDMRKYPVKSIW